MRRAHVTTVSPTDQAARGGAVLAPPADVGTLTVTGPDRLTWLSGIITCDVEDLAPGMGRWGLLLTRQGKILADVSVLVEKEAVRLGVARAVLARAHQYLSSFLIMEDADLADDSAALTWIVMHGPQASDVAARAALRTPFAHGSLDLTGLGGAAAVVAREREAEVRAALVAEGAVALSEEDVTRLRVERLVPLFGVDMDEQRSPHDVSLERRTVSWTKGCYLGQEAVCMQDMRGKVKRRLAIVRLSGTSLPPSGATVADASGAPVGETRSAALSTVFGAPLALSFLGAASAAPGTSLSVDGVAAEVVEPA